MTIPRTVLLACAAALTACNWGTRLKDFPVATRPGGVGVTARMLGSTNRVTGELMAVDSAGLYVLADAALIRIQWRDLERLDVDKLGSEYDVAGNHNPPEPAHRVRLGLVSRFPQGLSQEQLARVLGTLHQDSVRHVSGASLDSLALLATVAARRYENRTTAIADGYRRVGGDFPGMGEHWIRPASLYTNDVNANRPALLTYALIDGRPTLLGFGFVATTRGDSALAAPGWPDHWHEHSGLLSDEAAARPGDAAKPSEGTHVWVLHVWAFLENPGG